MRSILKLTLIAAALLALGSYARAADMPPRPPVYKAPPAPVAQNWSGFYFGINAAGAKTSTHVDFTTLPSQSGNISPAGGLAGATAGAGTWLGGIYVGVEADADYDFTKHDVPCVIFADCRIKHGWTFSQRGIIGIGLGALGNVPQALPAPSQWPIPIALPSGLSVANVMPYLTAGVVESDTKACISALGFDQCSHQWLVGLEAGGGIRIPVASGVSFDVSVLYDRFNKHFVPASPVVIFPATWNQFSETKARAAVVFNF